MNHAGVDSVVHYFDLKKGRMYCSDKRNIAKIATFSLRDLGITLDIDDVVEV